MKKDIKTFSIGPRAIAEASVEDGPAFALSASEWYAIQRYVTNSMSKEILPHTEEDFRAYLGPEAPKDLSDFIPLINAYKDIFDHVTVWNNETFPDSISLASDIVTYANQASIYYTPIIPLAEALTLNPNDELSKQKLEAILDILIKDADAHQSRAEIVFNDIKLFADKTAQDKIVLSGSDGNGGLYKHYEEKYGETSEDVQELMKDIETAQLQLEAANKDYEKYVTIAATTPTYAWVYPFGTIAAGTVAGIYGDKAKKALDDAKVAREQIKTFQADLQVSINLMNSIHLSNSSLSVNIESITAALPIIQKIQGAWGAISDDLKNISELVKTHIQDALPIIMDLGVEAAIEQWTAVGKLADAYRHNAYITIEAQAA